MKFRNGAILAVTILAATAQSSAALDWSAEVYGGISNERDEDYDGKSYPVDQGNTYGVGIYANGLIPGFTVGVDLMSTSALWTGYTDESVESISLMAVVRKDFAIGQSLEAYASGGLGAIRVNYLYLGEDFAGVVAGGQLAVGLRHSVGANASIFGEVKYQTAFKDADISATETQGYHSTNILVGFKLGF